jgi:hypothetical protein
MYYGGVQMDAALVESGGRKLLFLPPGEHMEAPDTVGAAILWVGLGLLDMPLSAIADTPRLPLVYSYRRFWDERSDSKDNDTSNPVSKSPSDHPRPE